VTHGLKKSTIGSLKVVGSFWILDEGPKADTFSKGGDPILAPSIEHAGHEMSNGQRAEFEYVLSKVFFNGSQTRDLISN